MKQERKEIIVDAIAMCDNACQAFNLTWETYFTGMTDDEVAESIYKDVLEIAEDCYGDPSIRFEGKGKIKAEIKKLMHNAEMFSYMNRKIKKVKAVKVA